VLIFLSKSFPSIRQGVFGATIRNLMNSNYPGAILSYLFLISMIEGKLETTSIFRVLPSFPLLKYLNFLLTTAPPSTFITPLSLTAIVLRSMEEKCLSELIEDSLYLVSNDSSTTKACAYSISSFAGSFYASILS
jgi:hypothetical protein